MTAIPAGGDAAPSDRPNPIDAIVGAGRLYARHLGVLLPVILVLQAIKALVLLGLVEALGEDVGGILAWVTSSIVLAVVDAVAVRLAVDVHHDDPPSGPLALVRRTAPIIPWVLLFGAVSMVAMMIVTAPYGMRVYTQLLVFPAVAVFVVWLERQRAEGGATSGGAPSIAFGAPGASSSFGLPAATQTPGIPGAPSTPHTPSMPTGPTPSREEAKQRLVAAAESARELTATAIGAAVALLAFQLFSLELIPALADSAVGRKAPLSQWVPAESLISTFVTPVVVMAIAGFYLRLFALQPAAPLAPAQPWPPAPEAGR